MLFAREAFAEQLGSYVVGEMSEDEVAESQLRYPNLYSAGAQEG